MSREISPSAAKWLIAREARARVLYGKKFNAIQHARVILEFNKKFFGYKLTQQVMQGLMRCTLEAPDYLRDIADTLIQLKNGGTETSRADSGFVSWDTFTILTERAQPTAELYAPQWGLARQQ
jgi:hypothetical protein